MGERRRVVMLAALAAAAGCASTWTMRFWTGADPTYDDNFDVQEVRERLTQLRLQYHVGPTTPFQVAEPKILTARKRIAEGADPELAFDHALVGSVDESGRAVRYWLLAVDRFEDLKFPRMLFERKRLQVAIGIVRHQGQARPRYVVVLATPSFDEHVIEMQ
jgi:hypothetical protein